MVHQGTDLLFVACTTSPKSSIVSVVHWTDSEVLLSCYLRVITYFNYRKKEKLYYKVIFILLKARELL